ncbi:MAG: hypothetical protein H6Q60_314 [Oscillospiraceae bacterium]|nr:hypothetical protein [Oscillospiraceae bacterium]
MTQKKQNLSTKKQKEDAILNKVLIWFGCALVLELILFWVNQWFPISLLQALTAVVPILAVIAMIYYLYQFEFFFITLVSVTGILGLWQFRLTAGGNSASLGLACLVLTLILIISSLAFLIFLQCNSGSIHIQSKTIRLVRSNTSYVLPDITCGLSALALLGGLFFGSSIAYYIIFAIVAWLFIMAVYYTVKMM